MLKKVFPMDFPTSSQANAHPGLPGFRPVTDLIRQARQGVLRSRVDEVATIVGLTDNEMAQVLNISIRGLHGKRANELLSLAAGERLLLFERLLYHGLSVFDGRADLLASWLRTPLAELAYRDDAGETALGGGSVSVTWPSLRSLGSFQPPYMSVPTANPAPDTAGEPVSKRIIRQSPLSVLDTVSGFSLVEDILRRIEWGILG